MLVLDNGTKYSKQSLWCSESEFGNKFAPSILNMKEIQVLSSEEELANENSFHWYIQTDSSEGEVGKYTSHDLGK